MKSAKAFASAAAQQAVKRCMLCFTDRVECSLHMVVPVPQWLCNKCMKLPNADDIEDAPSVQPCKPLAFFVCSWCNTVKACTLASTAAGPEPICPQSATAALFQASSSSSGEKGQAISI